MTNKKTVGLDQPNSLGELVAYAPDSVVSNTLLKKETGSITLFSFDAGQGLSEHTAPFDAMVLILEGAAHVRISQEVHTVGAGEMLIMPADIPHALHAEERFKMLLVMIKNVK